VKLKILLITLVAVAGMAAFADIYKWVDKEGKVHYSDKPPRDVGSKHMQIEFPDSSRPPDEGELRRRRLLEQAEKDSARRIEAQRAKSAAERAAREERSAQEQRCLEARKQLAVLQEQLPVYRDTEGKFHAKWLHDTYKGAREYLDDATRAAGMDRVRQQIVTVCQHPDDTADQDLARKQWIMSERCAAARADLEALEQPRAKTPRQTLEEKREEVKRYCKD